jgi:hypothetical protein
VAGSEDANYSIRVMQSDGRLEYEATEKMPDGSMKNVVYRTEGPTVIVQTTTKNHLHPENETRVFPIYIDESEEQTGRIVESILRRGLNQMLAKEHSPSSLDAEKEEKQWTKKLSNIECQKDRLLDLYLDQGVEKERYEIKRLELERAAKTVQAELGRIRNRQSRIRQLERDRDALLETYTRMVPTHIDGLSPEERHRIYKMMNLSLLGHRDGSLEISWAYDGGQSHRSNGEPTPPGSSRIPGR